MCSRMSIPCFYFFKCMLYLFVFFLCIKRFHHLKCGHLHTTEQIAIAMKLAIFALYSTLALLPFSFVFANFRSLRVHFSCNMFLFSIPFYIYRGMPGASGLLWYTTFLLIEVILIHLSCLGDPLVVY